ncbi:hypothetical protein HD73_1285 [Bacillus thuringiensis serovar kurstaki str. HD73]|nr:hypothetical protein HD73_1285 [Bacillus thuringiensis serovar kurstaki str. HD73]EEL66167.1 hypothetical protein bcere0025_9900 [Bacillus cereus F65185]
MTTSFLKKKEGGIKQKGSGNISSRRFAFYLTFTKKIVLLKQ